MSGQGSRGPVPPPTRGSFAVLLAGGIGTRLAPLSTPERPKQVLPLLPDGRTPLGATWDRVRDLFPPDRVLVITGGPMEAAVRAVLADLPDSAFLVEPSGRNTLPALAWATAEAARRGADRIASLHADHRVDDEAAFRDTLAAALAATDTGDFVLVGLTPTRPDPQLGWIAPGAPLPGGGRAVERFVEKPPVDVAAALMAAGALWNLGLFAWTIDAFAREAPPAVRAGFDRLVAGAPIDAVWPDLPRISVDHGLIEGVTRLRVVPGRFDWSDLGTWEAIGRTPGSVV